MSNILEFRRKRAPVSRKLDKGQLASVEPFKSRPGEPRVPTLGMLAHDIVYKWKCSNYTFPELILANIVFLDYWFNTKRFKAQDFRAAMIIAAANISARTNRRIDVAIPLSLLCDEILAARARFALVHGCAPIHRTAWDYEPSLLA